MKSLSCARLLATPWTAAHQAPLSMGFSRQEYWSALPLPSPYTYFKGHVFPRLSTFVKVLGGRSTQMEGVVVVNEASLATGSADQRRLFSSPEYITRPTVLLNYL